MEVSVPLWLLAVVGILLVLAIGVTAMWTRRSSPVAAPPAASPPRITAPGLAQTLEQLQQSGKWDELLRLLDRTLPEWTISSSLIEVARALAALEGELASVPAGPVSDVVTSRLAQQTSAVSDDLWRLAARVQLAARQGNARSRLKLEEDDGALVRLLAAMQEARAEAAELALGPPEGSTLDRAEGRFRTLAATARELRELEGESEIR